MAEGDPLGALAARIGRGGQPAPAFATAVLRRAIIIGLLRGGEAIRIDAVARSLGISAIPVREALREMEASRLVSFERNRGFVVAPESTLELRESFEARLALEPLALRLAMPDLTSRDTRKARAVLEGSDRGLALEELHAWNLDFHMALYAPCARRHILAFIELAHVVSHRYVHATLAARGVVVTNNQEHWAMLEACERRDTTAALAVLDMHLAGAAERVIANYERLAEGRQPRA